MYLVDWLPSSHTTHVRLQNDADRTPVGPYSTRIHVLFFCQSGRWRTIVLRLHRIHNILTANTGSLYLAVIIALICHHGFSLEYNHLQLTVELCFSARTQQRRITLPFAYESLSSYSVRWIMDRSYGATKNFSTTDTLPSKKYIR